MKSSGFLSEKLYMALNLDYLGLSKYILLAMAPTREVMAIYDRVKGDPQRSWRVSTEPTSVLPRTPP